MLCDGGDEWEDSVTLRPIIAWEITRESGTMKAWRDAPSKAYVDYHVHPILFDGSNPTHFRAWGIRRPDGKFEIGDTTCESEGEAIEQLKSLKQRHE